MSISPVLHLKSLRGMLACCFLGVLFRGLVLVSLILLVWWTADIVEKSCLSTDTPEAETPSTDQETESGN